MTNDRVKSKGIEPLARAAQPEVRPGLRTEGQLDARDASRFEDSLWDIDDVSEYLRIPISSIYKMTARKASVRIPCIRIGGSLRFRRVDIDRWLAVLTVSNLDTLLKAKQKALKVAHGNHSQANAP